MKFINRFLLAGVLSVFASNVLAETTTNAVPRDPKWVARHEGFVQIAKKGGVDLLFMGDSITDFWRNRGSNVWNRYYLVRNPANFGISGDRTEHVLWRMDHGELNGIKPKVVVLMIGTNNTGKERDNKTPRNTPPEVIQGVNAVIDDLRAKLPGSKILLLAIFPRADGGPEQQMQINEINKSLATIQRYSSHGKMVTFLDIGPKFLGADGALHKEVMPDLLHPNEHGYEIWADAMEPTLRKMLN